MTYQDQNKGHAYFLNLQSFEIKKHAKKEYYDLKPGFWMLSNKIYSKIKLKECENLKKNTTKTVT